MVSKESIASVNKFVESLGYTPTAVIPLVKFWSVVAIKGEARFNFWIRYETHEIIQSYLLKYKLSNTIVDKIEQVFRIPIMVK